VNRVSVCRTGFLQLDFSKIKYRSTGHTCLREIFGSTSRPTNNIYVILILGKMQQFDAIFEILGRAVFEAIEIKGHSMLNFEVTTSKFCNHFWKFGGQPWKGKTDLCMTNGSKVLICLTLIVSFFLHYLQE
jgi:hypothetical protein